MPVIQELQHVYFFVEKKTIASLSKSVNSLAPKQRLINCDNQTENREEIFERFDNKHKAIIRTRRFLRIKSIS